MDTILLLALVFCATPLILLFVWILMSRYYLVLFRTPHYSVKLLDNMRQVVGRRFTLDEDIIFKKFGKFDPPSDMRQVVEVGNIKIVYYSVNAKEPAIAQNTPALYWDLVRPNPKALKEISENDSMYSILKRHKPKPVNYNQLLFVGVCIMIAGIVAYVFLTNPTALKLG